MFETNLKRVVINISLAVAIGFGLYYLSTTHFSFMISLFHYQMFNIPAISYTLMRFLQILIPIFIMVPEQKIKKIKMMKVSFYLMGIFYLLGNTWIFYFLADNPLSMLSDLEATHKYLQLEALNFDYLVWDCYDLYGILFGTIEALLFFGLGYYADKSRRKSVIFYWGTMFCSIVLPFIYVFLLSGIGEFSTMWLQKNTILFTGGIFTGVAINVAATSYNLWGDIFWR